MRESVFFSALFLILALYLSLKLPSNEIQRQVLGAAINSPGQEVRPLISADGKTLYFCRRNYSDNTGGKSDIQDIWVSNLNRNGKWSEAYNIGAPINNKQTNTLCSVSEDGRTALFLDSYPGVKSPLAKSELTDNGWSKPKAVEIENFLNISSYYDFYHSESLEILLMAINKGTGRGDQDLHVAFLRKDGSYSEPVNLGRVVNTKQADFAPFLGSDGKTLFFASYGHPGQGGADLFMTRRLDNTWKKWSPPENLGNIINSANEEIYISVDGAFENVYIETFPKKAKIKNIVTVKLPERFKPDHLRAPGFPKDLLANQHIRKEADFFDISPERKEALVTNPDIATIPELESTSNRETKPDWTDPIPTAKDVGNYSFKTKRVAVQFGFADQVSQNTYFEFNNRALREHFKPQLNKVYEVLRENPGIRVQVHGHTDNIGPQSVNKSIGFMRASSVTRYFINRGISESRFEIVSYGESKPLASNDDEREGRELNRRVEINLIDQSGISMVYYLH